MIAASIAIWPDASLADAPIAVSTSIAGGTQPAGDWAAVPLRFGPRGAGKKPGTGATDEPQKEAQETKREKRTTRIHKGRIRRPAPPIIPPQTPRQGEARC